MPAEREAPIGLSSSASIPQTRLRMSWPGAVGIAPNTGWVFGVAPQPDIRLLAEATGFWFRWDQTTEQYDHPSMVVAIDRARVFEC